VCLYFIFPQPDHWFLVGNPLQTGEEVLFILQVFQHLLVLKMSDEGASLGDPMGKSEYQSRSEKRRREL
jgi:hypothetical protein